MIGMNLSSSVPEKKQEGSWTFGGPVIVTVIFFLLLAFWGGMQWYLNTLDKILSEQQALLEENASRLKGDAVDRGASFDARLTLATKQMNEEDPVDTGKLLNQLESLVIPNVKLTKYEFDKNGKSVIVEGETDTFKYVAQQLFVFKGDALFSNIRVDSLKKNLEGRIEFSFKAEFNK